MVKRTGSLLLSAFLAAGFFLWIETKQAHAYIDIGSATFFLQMLVASAFASLFVLKAYWRRVTARLSRVMAIFRGTKEPSQ